MTGLMRLYAWSAALAIGMAATGASAVTCGMVEANGNVLHSLTHANLERHYYTYAPSDLPTDTKYPLVVELHGHGACAEDLVYYTGWNVKADEQKFLLAQPQGVMAQGNIPGWEAGTCCINEMVMPSLKARPDDEGFLRKVVAAVVAANPNVDTKRIYFVGHSNGCMMAQLMAYKASDLVAAVGCMSLYLSPEEGPVDVSKPLAIPTPILTVHGTTDMDIPYKADDKTFPWLVGAMENFGNWAALNGCPSDADAVVTVEGSQEGMDYTISSISGCAGSTEVGHVAVNNTGHLPFYGAGDYSEKEANAGVLPCTVDTTAMAWDFVRRFSSQEAPQMVDIEAAKVDESSAAQRRVGMDVILAVPLLLLAAIR